MNNKELIELCFTIPFDNTLFVEHDLLGIRKEIIIISEKAYLEFPREPLHNKIGLQHPNSAPSTIEHLLPEKHWGLKKENHKESYIEACSIVFTIRGNIDFDLSFEQIGGEDVRSLSNSISEWFESFTHWIWLLTSQSMIPTYPDPKVIHRKSSNIITTASSNGKISVPNMFSNGISLCIQDGGQASEYLVNHKVLDLSIDSSEKPTPIAFELLASARMAARRSDFRRAVVDAGTASELALSELLEIDETKKLTLGGLITEVKKRNLKIPDDVQTKLVDQRNAAIHRGYISSNKDALRALEIAEQIVSMSVKEMIPFNQLKPFFRPQRQDFVIIKNTQKK